MARVLFGGLALVDAALLVYFVVSYDWFVFSIDFNNESIAGIFIIPLLWMLLIAEKAFFAAYGGWSAAAIVREITGKRDAHRGLAVLASLVLLALAHRYRRSSGSSLRASSFTGRPAFLIDRLTLFDGLAQNASEFGGLFGTASFFSGSIGRMLVILLGVAYLSEKYLLAWWRDAVGRCRCFRWSRLAGWRGAFTTASSGFARLSRPNNGGRSQRNNRGSRHSTRATTLGEGWRLPQREELTRYLSTQPPEIKGWKGSAWTATASDARVGGGRRPRAAPVRTLEPGLRADARREPVRIPSYPAWLCE